MPRVLLLFLLAALALPAAAQSSDRQRNAAEAVKPADTPPAQLGAIVGDGSFEAGSPNPVWDEGSVTFGTALCTTGLCGTGGGTGPHTGSWWLWFGGTSGGDTGWARQEVTIPAGTATLTFWLQIPTVTGGTGYTAVNMDGTEVFLATYADDQPTYASYTEVSVDVSAFAGGTVELEFESVTTGNGNFMIDDVSIEVVPPAGSAVLGVSPSSVNFGGVDVGDTGGPTTVTITNTGDATASISSIAGSGAPFSVDTGATSMTLAAGASTTFDVSFSPSATGAASGSVTITSDATNSPSAVALSGTGTDPDIETFPSTDTPIAITDNSEAGITSTIVIPGSETRNIADLDVAVNITHSWTGDLWVRVDRDSEGSLLFDRPGRIPTDPPTGGPFGCSGVNPNIIVDDEGTDGSVEGSCQTTNPAYTVGGRYTPTTPLDVFDTTPMAGTYVLTVSDRGAGDTGSLTSWALIITPEAVVEPGVIDQTVVRVPAGPVPAGGGDARIAFRFTNLTDAPISTTTWATLSIPGDGVVIVPGTDLELLARPKPLNLEAAGDPGDNRRWGMRFQLLAEAPEGDYVYTRYAGDQNGDVLVSESVTFTKSGAAAPTLPSVASEAPDADEAVVQIGADGAVTIIRGEGTESASTTQAASELRVSPNPMTTQGQAMLRVATTQEVRVALYDALGREVRVLFERSLTAGQQAYIGFRTADLPAGVYVVRATGADLSLTERITVVR